MPLFNPIIHRSVITVQYLTEFTDNQSPYSGVHMKNPARMAGRFGGGS